MSRILLGAEVFGAELEQLSKCFCKVLLWSRSSLEQIENGPFTRRLAMEAGPIIELPRGECYSLEPVFLTRRGSAGRF